MTLTAILMVSNIRYYSFKQVDFKGKIPFISVLLIVMLFVAIAAEPALFLFLASIGYAVSGPLQTLKAIHRVRKLRRLVVKRRKNNNEQL